MAVWTSCIMILMLLVEHGNTWGMVALEGYSPGSNEQGQGDVYGGWGFVDSTQYPVEKYLYRFCFWYSTSNSQ